MANDPPTHVFDVLAASRYQPDPSFVKTAILVEPFDSDAVTVIRAPFGEQALQGSFYIVAEGAGSYGVSRQEFETTHEKVGTNRWIKREGVLAYRSQKECLVETHVGETHEATVRARPGDWIVRRARRGGDGRCTRKVRCPVHRGWSGLTPGVGARRIRRQGDLSGVVGLSRC